MCNQPKDPHKLLTYPLYRGSSPMSFLIIIKKSCLFLFRWDYHRSSCLSTDYGISHGCPSFSKTMNAHILIIISINSDLSFIYNIYWSLSVKPVDICWRDVLLENMRVSLSKMALRLGFRVLPGYQPETPCRLPYLET